MLGGDAVDTKRFRCPKSPKRKLNTMSEINGYVRSKAPFRATCCYYLVSDQAMMLAPEGEGYIR